MNIAYACDNAYISQTGISIISLLENNKDSESICIYLISKDISLENVDKIVKIVEFYGRKINIINFCDICYDLVLSGTGRHIETIYAKIFLSRIIGLHKIIYLDSDTIVNGSLRELWEDKIDGYYFGVVETICSDNDRKMLCITNDSRFFNDGMAVINVDYCKENNLIERAKCELAFYHGSPPILSEGLLNKICSNKVKYISIRYNLLSLFLFYAHIDPMFLKSKVSYSLDDIVQSISEPVVIHFLSAYYNRPWNKKCSHPFRYLYFKYKAMSPWKDDLLLDDSLPFKNRFFKRLYEIVGCSFVEKLSKFYHNTKNFAEFKRAH